jgi:choline dehydrogenase
MLFRSHFLYLAVCLSTARAANDYEYIIVGSGAGGGPLAARLALAGHKTLLIEAGDDQGTNDNYTVPAYSPRATEDPSMSWDFFVRHFKDDEQQRNDLKLTYTCPGGEDYTGLSPPPGCEIKGVLYPRAGTLGGCTAHNALINIYPHKSDFQYLVDLTGDESWSPENMRKYLIRLEAVNYLQSVTDFAGHGSNGWLGVSHTPLNLAVDLQALGFLLGSIFALGNYTGTLINLATALAGDMNADNDFRDQ